MRRDVGAGVSQAANARYALAQQVQSNAYSHIAQKRAAIARFFTDLRRALRLTLPQAAMQTRARIEVLEALEAGRVEYLSSWAETARIVTSYTALAGIDSRPVLSAISHLLHELSRVEAQYTQYNNANVAAQYQVPHRAMSAAMPATYDAPTHDDAPAHGPQNMRAGFATRAMRLPRGAMQQIRRRPDRAFYTLSLPLGALILALNTSVLSQIAQPFSGAVRWAEASYGELFPPVRDGFRWIEVDDPRSRRADKLRISQP
jgi:hypothetical protein